MIKMSLFILFFLINFSIEAGEKVIKRNYKKTFRINN